jgi:hypothetical protein
VNEYERPPLAHPAESELHAVAAVEILNWKIVSHE